MKIEKITLSDVAQNGKGFSIVSRITYVQSTEYEKFDEINRTIAENLLSFCKRALTDTEGMEAGITALLTPVVTYVDDEIISVKYDFTVSENKHIIHHRRFCINMLYKTGVFILPGFLKGGKRIKSHSSFYLTRGKESEVFAFPVVKSLDKGVIIGRRSEIDTFCDGQAQKVGIKIPHCLTNKKVRGN